MGVIIFIIIGIIICGFCAKDSDRAAEALKEQQSLDEAKLKEIRKQKRNAFEELRYDRNKESEFWRYFCKRKKGKLTYIVPEFEERIVKMNKLKEKGRD